jgi:uncharacterized protein YndB with AHSA1/START domain
MITDKITVTITTPSDREAVVVREFNAPVALVFESITNPDLLKRWYGYPIPLDACESDPRVGGAYRFAFTVNGKPMAKFGVYTEFEPPRRFVRTERYEGWDDFEGLMTVELIERSGKTVMTQSFVFKTKELRDMVMKTGLTPQGMSSFFERLDVLLSNLKGEEGQ